MLQMHSRKFCIDMQLNDVISGATSNAEMCAVQELECDQAE